MIGDFTNCTFRPFERYAKTIHHIPLTLAPGFSSPPLSLESSARGFSKGLGEEFYKKNLLNTTQLAGWMKTGSPKARKHDIRWA
jgi:hypothetical protein